MSTKRIVKQVRKQLPSPSSNSPIGKKFSHKLPTNRVFQEFKVNMEPAEILSNTNDDIQFVWHLSDIHIRGYKEVIHEYKGVFLNLLDSMYNDIVNSHKIDNFDELINATSMAKQTIICDIQKVTEKIVPYSTDSLIIIAGDILHNHTSFDDASIILLRSWIRSLTYLSKVIILGGNHDYHLYEMGRQALSGLLDIDNTYVLLKSKNYIFNNIALNCFSLYDKLLPNVAELICENKINISLYHGQVNANHCRPDTELKYECLPLETFDCTSHYGFFGDRHSHEYLDKEHRYAYPSNLVQIHRKEHVSNHGYLYRDIITGKSKYTRVKNVFGRVNFTFVENKLINKPELAEENIAYCKCINSDPTICVPVMKEYIKEEGKKCIKVHIKNKVKREENVGIEYNNETETLSSSECQIKLINQYIEQNPDRRSKEFIDDVLKIHNNLFECIDKIPQVVQNKNFQIRRMFFHNIYSFGPNNMLDFKNLRDVIGVNGLNYSGKTNLFKTIIFSIFGCPELDSPKSLINNESNGDLYTLIEIVQEGVIYAILRANAMAFKNPEKKFDKNSYTGVITELLVCDPETNEYSKFDESFTMEQSEKKIIEICGNKLNFHKLFFMLQSSKSMNFIDISGNIKDTFYYFSDHYDYHIFDSLWRKSISIIGAKENELTTLTKTLKKEEKKGRRKTTKTDDDVINNKKANIKLSITNASNNLKRLELLINCQQIKLEKLKTRRSELQLQSTLAYVNNKFPEFAEKSIDELHELSLDLQNKISEKSQTLDSYLKLKEDIEVKINHVENLREQNISIIDEKMNQLLESNTNTVTSILNFSDFETLILQKNEVSVLESKIKHSENILYSTKEKIDEIESGYIFVQLTEFETSLQKLQDLVTLPKNKKLSEELMKIISFENFITTNKNKFLKIISSEQKKLNQYYAQHDKLKHKQYINFKNYVSKFQTNNPVEIVIISELNQLIKQINSHDNEIKRLFIEQGEIDYIYKEHYDVNSNYNEEYDIIQEVLQNITINEKIDIEIRDLNDSENEIIGALRENNKAVINSNKDKTSFEKDLIQMDADIARCKVLEGEIEKYKYYKNMICPNGIPKLILKNILHKTEIICNQILNIFSDMSVNFEIKDGSPNTTKDHDAYPQVKIYTTHRIPLDLSDASSGFQSFILNFAIKASIIKLFNIKSIDFIILDEFLSVLDAYKIDHLDEFFNYIKKQYNTIFIVSHNKEVTRYYTNEIQILQKEKASCLRDNLQFDDQISASINEIITKFVIVSKNQKKQEQEQNQESKIGNAQDNVNKQLEEKIRTTKQIIPTVVRNKKTLPVKSKPKIPQEPLRFSLVVNDEGLYVVEQSINNTQSNDTQSNDINNNDQANNCNDSCANTNDYSESSPKTNSDERRTTKRPRGKQFKGVIDVSIIHPDVIKMKENSVTLSNINKKSGSK